MKAHSTCPDAESLVGMLDNDLPEAQQEQVTQHVGSCDTCQHRVETLVTHGFPDDLDFENVGTHLRNAAKEEATLSREAIQRLTSVLSDVTTAFQERRGQLSLDFLEPSVDPNSLGRLGQYEITEVIGRGGMGIALKGRDTRLDRVVAVKVLAPELASNPTARRRFLREARAAAAVSHDHVVTTFAVESGDLPYLAMEFIDGQSLQQKIDRNGPQELREILRIGMQTAYGLAAAHAQGLIHRDIKPSNIMLQNSVERVQITDFGLARAVDDVTITRTGEVAGTPTYMSPEQAQGLPVDRRADLFSFGSVLYAMCTGRSPFRAESTMAVLHRVCNDSPRPINEVNPDIPAWLIAIIDRLLEKEAGARFQTAAEVADLLSQCLAHVQQPAVVPLPEAATSTEWSRNNRTATRRPKWYVGAILLILVFGSLGLTEATGVTQFSASVISIVRGDGTLVVEVNDPEVSVTIEGEDIVITGAGPQEVRLRPGQYQLKAQKDGTPVPLEQELVSISRGDRRVVRVTLQPKTLSNANSAREIRRMRGHAAAVRDISLSADGKSCLSGGIDQTLRIWNVQTGKLVKAIHVGEYIDAVALSPNGELGASGTADGKVVLWNLESGESIRVFPSQKHRIARLAFSPDGTLLVSRAIASLRVWNVETEALHKDFALRTEGAAFDFSPDGTTFLFADGNALSCWETASGRQLWSVTLEEGVNCWHVAYSPDGKSIANTGKFDSIEIRHAADGALIGRFIGHKDNQPIPAHFLFSANSDHLISISKANEMIVSSIETLAATHRISLGNTLPHRIAITTDGRAAITCGGARWDASAHRWIPGSDFDLHIWQLPESVWPEPSPLDKEIAEYQRIIEEKSHDSTQREEVASAYADLGAVLQMHGRHQEAERVLREGINLLGPYFEQNGHSLTGRVALINMYVKLSYVIDPLLNRSPRVQLNQDMLRKAVHLAEELVSDFPKNEIAINWELNCLTQLAGCLGKTAEGRKVHAKAMELAEATRDSGKMVTLLRLEGSWLNDDEQFEEAERVLRRSVSIAEERLETPEQLAYPHIARFEMGESYRVLADSLEGMGRTDDAIDSIRMAIAIFDKFREQDPENTVYNSRREAANDTLSALLEPKAK